MSAAVQAPALVTPACSDESHERATEFEGRRFGSMVALRLVGRQGTNQVWLCRCDCGTEKPVRRNNLLSGGTQSCGCQRLRLIAERKTTHGHRTEYGGSPTYRTWRAMIQRCTDPKTNGYTRYGARGVTVCERWLTSFDAFLADMGVRPSGKTLDRIDPDGHYEPSNCRWATSREQRRNRRKGH